MKFQREGTLIAALGMEIVEIIEGRVVMTMPVDERTRQPFGYLHGGASVALAETAASLGAAALIDPEMELSFGLEINANHIKSKRDGIVTATAEIEHRGRTTMVWTIKITDEEGALISLSRCTMAVVEKR
ncbi:MULTISPECIES: hotdog fold thioesterase [Bacillaceae]|uniref:Esterase n=1 Tax=Domibacillus aminovorans TaxID=29332 RepID=A0A177KY94_9BACI|nr:MULTISPECIES: hotdog fold thioesterase [Bacillaceae]OAH58313.1 esterase [Domibacillus aminovorans]OAH61536.1 esterase [Domibacillus aminovorans]